MTADRRTAIHEAGHAVTAYLLGVAFAEISATPDLDAGSLGHVAHTPATWFRPDVENDARHARRIEQHIMILLAGAETEAAWFRRTDDAPADWEELVQSGRGSDDDQVADLAMRTSGSAETAEAYIQYLRQTVLDWTGRDGGGGSARYWLLVNALADAVQDAGRLSWRKSRDVLRDTESRGRIRIHLDPRKVTS